MGRRIRMVVPAGVVVLALPHPQDGVAKVTTTTTTTAVMVAAEMKRMTRKRRRKKGTKTLIGSRLKKRRMTRIADHHHLNGRTNNQRSISVCPGGVECSRKHQIGSKSFLPGGYRHY
uniref:Putative secreted peptide n=1 Tax=Anopheles braziliensis TaxID=58242 RepID=A0A2M3ZU84_9DIPT